jgi:large subunit ribosomal protein L35Ae
MSYKRAKNNSYNHTALVKIQGCEDGKAARFYEGKRVAYIYKGHKEKDGHKYRVSWGTVTRPHGTNGCVRAKFRKNLPGHALGGPLRVMMYPSSI